MGIDQDPLYHIFIYSLFSNIRGNPAILVQTILPHTHMFWSNHSSPHANMEPRKWRRSRPSCGKDLQKFPSSSINDWFSSKLFPPERCVATFGALHRLQPLQCAWGQAWRRAWFLRSLRKTWNNTSKGQILAAIFQKQIHPSSPNSTNLHSINLQQWVNLGAFSTILNGDVC